MRLHKGLKNVLLIALIGTAALLFLTLFNLVSVRAATVSTVPFGGTGFGSYTRGDILIATTSSLFKKLNVGANGQLLMLLSGFPTWTSASTSAISEGTNLYFTNGRAQSALAGLYEVPLTFSTGLTRSTNTVTVNAVQNITKLSNLTSNGLVKTSGSDGTLSIATAGSDYSTGSGTSGNCVKWGASNSLTDFGSACSAGDSSFAYPFISDATSTLLNFNGGLTAYASSTIGSGGIFGLTVNGSATTTGRLVVGYTGNFTSNSGANLNVAGGNSNTQAIAHFGNTNFTTDQYIDIGSAWFGYKGNTGTAIQGTGSFGIGFYVNNGTTFATGVTAAILTSGGLYGVGTTTPFGRLSASSTSATVPALAVDQQGTGPVAMFSGGKVTMSTTSCSGFLCMGTTGSTNGTSTIATGKIQFDGYSASGARTCAYIVGTAWVIKAGACIQ